VFPDRVSTELRGRGDAKRYVANDFTVAEIKRLDAGRWKDAKFAGATVPTFEEMVALVRGKAGIYPELKSPPLYTARGVDMAALFVTAVKKMGLDTPESLRATPVIIQSFDIRTLQYLHQKYPDIKTSLLIEDKKTFATQLKELGFIPNIYSPDYILVTPLLVQQCHASGIKIIPWTVNDKEEIQKLQKLGVDGIISDYPNLLQ